LPSVEKRTKTKISENFTKEGNWFWFNTFRLIKFQCTLIGPASL